MPHKSGMPKSKYPPGAVKQEKKKERVVPYAGPGSSGDIRDRFGGVYKPGAHPPPKPGLRSPMDAIKKLLPKKKNPAK